VKLPTIQLPTPENEAERQRQRVTDGALVVLLACVASDVCLARAGLDLMGLDSTWLYPGIPTDAAARVCAELILRRYEASV
jgi:hypothetical protein